MCLKIASVGDIMLGENVHHYGRGVASRYMGHFQDLLESEVLGIINDADLFFGNFECSLLPDADWKSAGLERSMYAAPESATEFFKDWKPAIILNVANNHFGQHGSAAADYTVECLEKIGIRCIGRTCHPVEIQSEERRVVAWGVSIVEDRYVDAGYFKSTPENLIKDIDWVEKQPDDYWVVSIHWGAEYLTKPSEVQKELASKLVEKGVDLILGHHPHVVQPVRQQDNAVVAYSHGNFIFDQNFSKLTRIGFLLSTNAGNREFQLYEVVGHKYCAGVSRKIAADQLEEFCRENLSFSAPLKMRVLMKLELLIHALEVPASVWAHFGSRFLRKAIK